MSFTVMDGSSSLSEKKIKNIGRELVTSDFNSVAYLLKEKSRLDELHCIEDGILIPL